MKNLLQRYINSKHDWMICRSKVSVLELVCLINTSQMRSYCYVSPYFLIPPANVGEVLKPKPSNNLLNIQLFLN